MLQPLMLCGKALSGFPKHRSRMPEHILPSPQKARSAIPKSLSGTEKTSCPSHTWTYITGCQANTRNAHKQRICIREPMPSAVGRSRGVEDGREWIIMHIHNACWCKHACFCDTLYHYSLAAKVETQNLASHKQGKHLFPAYSPHAYIAMDC